MARKSRSTLQNLLTLFARIPWWLALLAGVVNWWLLRQVVANPPATPVLMEQGELPSVVIYSAAYNFALVGQYLIPLLCLLVAVGSVLIHRRRKAR